MFGPRSSGLALAVGLIAGCGESGEPLSRLAKAWAAETSDRASDSMTASLVLSAIAVEVCIQSSAASIAWEPSSALAEALGEPQLESSEEVAVGTQQFVWSGLQLAGRTQQWLRFTALLNADGVSIDFEPLESGDGSVERLEGFGHASLAVAAGCSESSAFVSGEAIWVEADGRRHEVRLPADADLASSVLFESSTPWLPVAGAIAWKARVEGQDRSITTDDASEIRVDDGGDAQWPVTVHGPSWSGEGLTRIAP